MKPPSEGCCDWRARLALCAAAALVFVSTLSAPPSARLAARPAADAGAATLLPPSHAAAAGAGAAPSALAVEQMDCGVVAVPPDADCFFTDCAGDVCADVCIKPSPSYGDYKTEIRREYAWAFAYWRAGGQARQQLLCCLAPSSLTLARTSASRWSARRARAAAFSPLSRRP